MTVQIYDARLDLEEAERKAQKMETDYEILMVENSHLTEEIDKFGEIVQRAERALAGGAASELGLGSSGGGDQPGENHAGQLQGGQQEGDLEISIITSHNLII